MTAPHPPATAPSATPRPGRSAAVCALLGAAVMAAVDEIVFHQILAWHHFYDRATPRVSLVTDGLLHTAEVLALLTGAVLLADLSRRRALSRGHAWAGALLGAGGFQLFDGVVDHKVLRTHQIRYGVELLPYDLAWNGGAVVLLVLGALLWLRAARRPAVPRGPATEGPATPGTGTRPPSS